MRQILIELPTWLGDTVMTSPAIENLLKELPGSRLTFIGSDVSTEIMKFHPSCDAIIKCDKKISTFFSTIKILSKFDIFISFRSSLRSTILKFLVKADEKYQYKKNSFTSGHQVEKYNQFVNLSLGIKLEAGKLKIHHSPYPRISKNPLLGINPGASYGSAKCWPYEKYAEVATSLSKKFDILIFGGNKELNLVEKIESKLKENNCRNYVNLAGRTSTKELIDYISSLDLFITGDSGPMHIAAAFRIPTVSIFGPTKEYETCQWMNDKSSIIKKDLACQPCMERVCPLKHHDCMKKISSREVINSALSLT